MKVSLNWLKRYIDLKASVEELESVFPGLGFEVESISYAGMPPLKNVVVGEVLSREPHPDADKLGVCQVKVGGDSEPVRQIVCGASNYKVGDKIPVALEGAYLPGDFKIKKSKLRGVPSEGMMCAAQELGLSDDTPGLMILDEALEVGTPINDIFKDNDVVFDLELTANRGDCASHIGIARELSAYYKLPLRIPDIEEPSFADNKNGLIATLNVDTKECPLYMLYSVKGVKVGPSPEWLRKDLEAIGLRPVNNIVDITNWVMMETGQPLHAFDAGKIESKSITVRLAAAGEEIITLDEKKRKLSSEDIVIADSSKPIAIAGIMGDFATGVTESTVDVVIESAYFNRGPIRKTSRSQFLSTDSSYRFARDVDPLNVAYAAHLAVTKIADIAGGAPTVECMHMAENPPRKPQVIELTGDYIRSVGGYGPENEEIKNIFKCLGFEVEDNNKKFIVTVPTFRADIYRPIDLAEECLRIYGPDKIPTTEIIVKGLSREDDLLSVFNHKASDYLVGQSFDECYHYSLQDGKKLESLFGKELTESIKLENPLTADHTHIRPSLIPSLLEAVRLNQDNGNSPRRFFEVGRVHRPENGKIREFASIGFVMVLEPGTRFWLNREFVDFYSAKNIALEIGRLSGIRMNPQALNFAGLESSMLWQDGQAAAAGESKNGYTIEVGLLNLKTTKEWGIDSPIIAGEILIGIESFRKQAKRSKFKEFSHFPASKKDIALVMDSDTPAQEALVKLESVARSAVGDICTLEDVSVFDVYRGKGLAENKKSLAFSLTFRGIDRTLKDKEIHSVFDSIQKSICEGTGFEVRT